MYAPIDPGECAHLGLCAEETRCNLGALASDIECRLLDDAKAMLMKLKDARDSSANTHLTRSQLVRYCAETAELKDTFNEICGRARELNSS